MKTTRSGNARKIRNAIDVLTGGGRNRIAVAVHGSSRWPC